MFQVIQTWWQANPAQATATLSLLAALGCNWALGVAVAMSRGQFSLQQLARILESQFASTEVKVIVGMLGTALATMVAGSVSINVLRGDNRELMAMLITITLNTLAAASALYSVQIWHECVLQVKALITGSQPLPSKVAAAHPGG